MKRPGLFEKLHSLLAVPLRLIFTEPGKFVVYSSLRFQAPEKIFADIYRKNGWGDPHSRSGPGSTFSRTEIIRRTLPMLVEELECRSVLDIPCGDFCWMSQVDLSIELIGADIVADLIKRNQQEYGRSNRQFVKLNLITDPLPKVDLVLCRDALVHFSFRHIFQSLDNLKSSGSTYLLTTTFTDKKRNIDIPTGGWHPLNLQRPPFNFPAPIKIVNENCTVENGRFLDKCLGLWKMTDLELLRRENKRLELRG